MSDRKARFPAPARLALVTLVASVLGCVLAGPAGAAAPTPESATNCGGSLTKGKATVDDPNLVNYKFNCDWGITGYTQAEGQAPREQAEPEAGRAEVARFRPNADRHERSAVTSRAPPVR